MWAMYLNSRALCRKCTHKIREVHARSLFDEMPQRNLFTLNARLSSSLKSGQPQETWALFHRMHRSSIELSSYTFTPVLGACSFLLDISRGKQTHALMVKNGTDSEPVTNLVVERALHEVREKARNDVEKAAVERGPTECQQNAVGDSVKPKERQADSPQRCKARLERQRRTAERAARALAEKIMCDLAAEREQAERNRLADSLGAEVKRWATGKEGNLRALLSTLQYILGPDSGWKPIPLTEVITPVAVKKAYRKATLYVHPDKVQQRGANVQQKFICEKVFDLIKDAWNKFNSDA